jgi:nucleotide-binding universal stress UspA family protein
VVLHVVEESAYAYPFPVPPVVRVTARRHLDETVAALRSRALRASGILRDGVASDSICAAATEASADLVVVGSQGRRGLPRLVLGSVAERVVRSSPIPVLTVHPSDHVAIQGGGMDKLRSILATTALDEASQPAVDLAVRVALDLDASLTLLHVYELPPWFGYYKLEGIEAAAEAEVRRKLGEACAHAKQGLARIECVARRGPAWGSIVEVAKERRAELIVLGTHARHGLSRALLGSVAEKVVRTSPVPVLTVGATAREAP